MLFMLFCASTFSVFTGLYVFQWLCFPHIHRFWCVFVGFIFPYFIIISFFCFKLFCWILLMSIIFSFVYFSLSNPSVFFCFGCVVVGVSRDPRFGKVCVETLVRSWLKPWHYLIPELCKRRTQTKQNFNWTIMEMCVWPHLNCLGIHPCVRVMAHSEITFTRHIKKILNGGRRHR